MGAARRLGFLFRLPCKHVMGKACPNVDLSRELASFCPEEQAARQSLQTSPHPNDSHFERDQQVTGDV